MLEQIAYQIPRASEERQVVYQVGDLESLSASALYYGDGSSSGSSSGFGGGFGGINKKDIEKYGIMIPSHQNKGPSGGGSKPSLIGTYSDFQKEGLGNISRGLNLGRFAQEAEGYSLTERYDASEHGDSTFHLNQDVIDRFLGKVVSSGKSKKSEDGWKGLGSAHLMDIFNSEE